MSGRDSFQPHPRTHFAPKTIGYALLAQHLPRQNRLLAALPPEDYECLQPHLESIALPVGWPVQRAGERDKYLYFLTAGIVSTSYVAANGAQTQFAVTGNEGVIGVASILGGESMPSQAVVLSAGFAYRLGAELLTRELKHHDQLLGLLLRYTQALIVQTGQMAVCNRHHTIEQQLCRCILSHLDRVHSNDLMLTQEMVADSLGVRRESVTEAAGKLQKDGVIHYSRGHIAVLDRPRLEAQTCECYAVVKRAYDRLLPSEDSIGDAGAHGIEVHDRGSISRTQGRCPSLAFVT